MLTQKPKRYRYPLVIISAAAWSYHRFNDSYRDVQERLLYRGITVSHETIREWCIKFGRQFKDVIKKRESKPNNRWHLDEQTIRINKKQYIFWRAVDTDGYGLDVFLQQRRNKKAAIRFLSRLLNAYPVPKISVTDKLQSYIKPIRHLCKEAIHLKHKRLNNRVENAHQPTRRKEKCLIRFKSPKSAQLVLSLMGKVRNIFAVDVGRYTNPASIQREQVCKAKAIWDNPALQLLCA